MIRTAFLLLCVLWLSGCGKFASFGSEDRKRGCAGTDCTMIANRFKISSGLAKQTQLLPAFQRCLKLSDADISAQTKSVFKTVKLSLSAEGKMQDLNAPMLMALTQLAGEVCSDRFELEVRTGVREFFGRFGGPEPVPSLEDSIAKFARSCWGREAMGFETRKIAELFANSSAGQGSDKGAALFLCTLTLSTPDVLVY